MLTWNSECSLNSSRVRPRFVTSSLKLRDRSERFSNDMRHMAHRLHPAALVHLGLVSALRSHCAEVSRNEGMRVEFRVASEVGPIRSGDGRLPLPDYPGSAFGMRLNTPGKVALVEIDQDRHGIHLSIVDKGVGFDLRAPKGAAVWDW